MLMFYSLIIFMKIEGVFLKISEVLNSYKDKHCLYKSSITHLFSNGLLLELNVRNIENPFNNIFFEKRDDPEINQCFDFLENDL